MLDFRNVRVFIIGSSEDLSTFSPRHQRFLGQPKEKISRGKATPYHDTSAYHGTDQPKRGMCRSAFRCGNSKVDPSIRSKNVSTTNNIMYTNK